MLAGTLAPARERTPLSSPKPPVCTAAAGKLVVGTAELPLENVLTAITLGIAGAGSCGILLLTFNSGAAISVCGRLRAGAGSTMLAAGAGVTGSSTTFGEITRGLMVIGGGDESGGTRSTTAYFRETGRLLGSSALRMTSAATTMICSPHPAKNELARDGRGDNGLNSSCSIFDSSNSQHLDQQAWLLSQGTNTASAPARPPFDYLPLRDRNLAIR